MPLVTQDGWNVSTEFGGHIEGVRLSVFKGFLPSGKPRYGMHNGRMFSSCEEARAFALERGYLQEYFGRPKCFLGLFLPRALRRQIYRTRSLRLLEKFIDASVSTDDWKLQQMSRAFRDGSHEYSRYTATPLYLRPKSSYKKRSA